MGGEQGSPREKGRQKIVMLTSVLALALPARPVEAQHGLRFQYAVKVLCTANIAGTSQRSPSLLPGAYQTAVNIHNPSPEPVAIRRKIALASGQISPFVKLKLKPDEATSVSCERIAQDHGPFIHGFEGFLVIESTGSVDVIAVYTAGKNGGEVESIAVEQARERKIR